MRARPRTGDEAIRPTAEDGQAPGLEGMPRADMGALEASVPSLLDSAMAGPLVLTRHGADAFVLLPIDAWRRHWAAAPRPPLLEGKLVDEAKD